MKKINIIIFIIIALTFVSLHSVKATTTITNQQANDLVERFRSLNIDMNVDRLTRMFDIKINKEFCHDFTKDLSFFDKGNEVKALQIVLQKEGYMDNYEKKGGDYVYHIKTIKAVSSFVEDYNLSSNNLFHDAGLRLQNRSKKKINELYGCKNQESGFIGEFSKNQDLYYVGFRNPEVENKYGLTKKSVAEDFTQEKLEEYSNSMACTQAAEWFEALEKGDKLQKFYTVEDIYNRGEYINIKESVGKYFSEEHLNKIKEKDNYSERAEIEDYWVKIKPGKELSEKYIEDNIFRVDPPEEINGEGIEIISGSNACSSGYQVSKDFKIMKCSGGGTAAKFKDGIFQGKTFENECKYAGFDGVKIKNTKESIYNFFDKIDLLQ